MLKLKNINTYYGKVHALKNVSLHLSEGEIVTLIGANGAGKTTILNTISGLTPAAGGDLLFCKESIKGLSPDRVVHQGVSQVPEGRQVFKPMSVDDNLELGAYLRYRNRQSKKDIQADKEYIFSLFPRLKERQKQAAFSDTIFVVGTRLLTKKGGDIKDFADLKGKAVVVTSGTTSEVLLHKLNEEKKMDMRIISAKDHGDSFRTLESGRAVAFMMDDALLAGERAKAKKPDNWEIVGTAQSKEAYGCMMRKDDAEFKKLVDDTIAQVQTSGEAEKWFDKWFKNPIPPKNLNMNFELSDDMKALFKEPNDKALN